LINGILSFEGNVYYFLITFAILGGGIKYVDDAFDEKTFKKRNAMILAPVLGILWGYTSYLDGTACTLLLAVLISVIVTAKIDCRAHQIGLIPIVVFLLVTGSNPMWIPLGILVIAGIVDEKGNDVFDEEDGDIDLSGMPGKIVDNFFKFRFSMKVVVIIMTVFGIIPLYFLVAFLLFDAAYEGIRLYSRRLRHKSRKDSVSKAGSIP